MLTRAHSGIGCGRSCWSLDSIKLIVANHLAELRADAHRLAVKCAFDRLAAVLDLVGEVGGRAGDLEPDILIALRPRNEYRGRWW